MSSSPSAGTAPSPGPSPNLSPSSPAPSNEPPPPSPPPTSSDQTSTSPSPSPLTLPPLSASEFKEYNRLAEHMDLFHNHFRSTWNLLYTSASTGRRAQGLSIRAFINAGLEFVSHLETHHTIEERYVFPGLARRMPEFRTGRERPWDLDPVPNPTPTPTPATSDDTRTEADREKEKEKEKEREAGKKKAAELLRQHVEIHKGMDGLRDYLRKCLSGETELQMSALKAQLDTWGTVLWTHLDQEVRTLGAENMRRYWSVEEVRRIRM
ncbi:hypothetical protein GGR51DRAFT_561491 [Nemania sp. FL0031]|nr:hypothetical protein GGR51DRAFT_561491 [Nemania sp. FL0031]